MLLDFETYADIFARDMCRDKHFERALAEYLKTRDEILFKDAIADCVEHSQCRLLFEDEEKKPFELKKMNFIQRVKLAFAILLTKNR